MAVYICGKQVKPNVTYSRTWTTRRRNNVRVSYTLITQTLVLDLCKIHDITHANKLIKQPQTKQIPFYLNLTKLHRLYSHFPGRSLRSKINQHFCLEEVKNIHFCENIFPRCLFKSAQEYRKTFVKTQLARGSRGRLTGNGLSDGNGHSFVVGNVFPCWL